MAFSPSLLLITLICLFSSLDLYADELYILKNVKVHTEASLESPVTKLIFGGEKVNILSIDGDFTEIEDKDKKTGWVSSDFLTDIEPVRIVLNKKTEKKTDDQAKGIVKNTIEKPTTKKTESKKNTDKSSDANQKELTSKKEDQYLQRQFEKICQIVNDLPETINTNYDNSSSGILKTIFNLESSNLPLWLALGGLIAGFIMGLLWSDYRQRRHHGGFKV